jgi:hypothetical protein
MMDNDNDHGDEHGGGGGIIIDAEEITSTMKKSYPTKKIHQMKMIYQMTMRMRMVISSMLKATTPTKTN